MIHRYNAYGLEIDSDLLLPELKENHTQPPRSADVRIRIGAIPEGDASQRTRIGPFSSIGDATYWLEVPNIVRLRVSEGHDIVVDPGRDADADSVRAFLLGAGFGALLFQRGLLVLHGNAIRIGDQCLVCVGPSGAGKSSLSAGFLARGYEVLSDDVVPINSMAQALPGLPRIKLWQDAAESLAFDIQCLRRIRPLVGKYSVPVPRFDETAPLPVRWVYILNSEKKDEVTLEPIDGMQRMKPLIDNAYSKNLVRSPAQKAELFRQISALAGRIHLSHISRSGGSFTVGAMVDKILADIAERP